MVETRTLCGISGAVNLRNRLPLLYTDTDDSATAPAVLIGLVLTPSTAAGTAATGPLPALCAAYAARAGGEAWPTHGLSNAGVVFGAQGPEFCSNVGSNRGEIMTEIQARAEVVGYPEPVLQAIRELVVEVDANPAMAAFAAQMMAGISAGLLADDNRA